MYLKILATLFLLPPAFIVNAQQNFRYTPEKPKPGDVIHFSYEPAGDIANTTGQIACIIYQYGATTRKADDLPLKKGTGEYSASFATDSSASFVNLVFRSGNDIDNNFNEGYYILLYDDQKPISSSYYNLANFFQIYSRRAGVDANNEKSLMALEKEFGLYPENKKKYLADYLKIKTRLNKANEQQIIQEEIESLLKSGLVSENDYTLLEMLYTSAKLPEQQKLISGIKKRTFPDGEWQIADLVETIKLEQALDKKKELINDLIAKISSNEKWAFFHNKILSIKSQFVFACLNRKDWSKLNTAIAEGYIEDKSLLAGIYNDAANAILESAENMEMAASFSQRAVDYWFRLLKNPAESKPDFIPLRQWEEDIKGWYAMYAMTYAKILYKIGDYKKGFEYAKDAAMVIHHGKVTEENVLYAMLAAKVLPAKQYISQLEQFVIEGKSTEAIEDILKVHYEKKKTNDVSSSEYISGLRNKAMNKLLTELSKSMFNEKAPDFVLKDQLGKEFRRDDFKGKTIILDFWATWCGPCKASFPAMQKVVNKYKDSSNVVVLFVDTWERKGTDNVKAATDLITKNKYKFSVLFDTEDNAATLFKLTGLPTKVVIDKNGVIRFKSFGYDGNEENLINEVSAMIEMASR